MSFFYTSLNYYVKAFPAWACIFLSLEYWVKSCMLCNSWRKWRKWQWPKGLVKLIHYFRFTFSINRQPHPPHLRSSSCTRRTRTSGKRQRSWWGWRGLFDPEMLKPLFGIVVFVRSLIASETSTRITNAVKIYSNLLVRSTDTDRNFCTNSSYTFPLRHIKRVWSYEY